MLLAALALLATSDLAHDLALAIDLPTPGERAARALELAARSDIPLEQWLDAMRAFGGFGPPSGDRGFVHVALPVLGTVEGTNLHVLVPEGYDPARPAPLILALPDAGAGGEQMIQEWQTAAQALKALVLAPTEPLAKEGYGFTARETENVLASLRWMRRRFHVDEERIWLAGVGRGGHLAWELALRRPDRFAALAPMLGSPALELAAGRDNLRLLENVAALPIRDLQGALDDVQRLDTLRLAFTELQNLGARDARLVEFAERAASYDFDAVNWLAFLGNASRSPQAERVVVLSARPGSARNAWAEITGFEKSVAEDFGAGAPLESWRGLEPSKLRARMLKEAAKRTARLEVVREQPGRFRAEGSGVASFRLLLTAEMLGPGGRVELVWQKKTITRTLIPDKRVLLAEFVERFDRGFLPVAELRVP